MEPLETFKLMYIAFGVITFIYVLLTAKLEEQVKGEKVPASIILLYAVCCFIPIINLCVFAFIFCYRQDELL